MIAMIRTDLPPGASHCQYCRRPLTRCDCPAAEYDHIDTAACQELMLAACCEPPERTPSAMEIGDPLKEVEFEPIEAPEEEPAVQPVVVPEPEPEPALEPSGWSYAWGMLL